MASPTDTSRTPTNFTTAVDPWSVNLPGSIASGDTLLMFLRLAGPQTATTPSGWTLLDSDGSDASNDNTYVFWRKADGAEGATQSVDMSGAIKGAAIVYRITGAADPTVTAPEYGTSPTPAVGTGANADPGTVTPSGGSDDYLFVVFAGLDGETQTFSAAPSGYSNLQSANSGTGSTPATNCVIASASKQATASSENPGTFTNAAPEGGWTAYTIAIYPAAGGTVTDQAVTGSVLITATASRLSNKIASASALATASIVKLVAKTVSAQATTTASVLKDVSKSLSSTVLVTATLEAIRAFALTVSATVLTTATITKSAGKIVSASVSLAATIVREASKLASATVTVSATMVRSVAKSVSATTAVSASASAIKVVLQTLSASVTVAASLVATFIPGGAVVVAKLRTLMGMGR